MDYTEGKMGRVFIVRVDHDEDILIELQDLAKNENIKSAFFYMLGAAGSADVVTGPKEKSLPPDVDMTSFDDARELLGTGNIFLQDGSPKIHLHAAAGNRNGMIMGCLRNHTEVFMVMEIVIFEITGITAERVYDKDIGFSPLRFYQ
ncbi:MAG: DUF296 domain-containing protein [ANME-2 cluster archaeon]|nr:MAG: DUF296 domain-containing protein [ANME-2 cluster archaeon]